MKPDKITKKDAKTKLKALGIEEKDVEGLIKIRLSRLREIQKRDAIDAIIAEIGEEEG